MTTSDHKVPESRCPACFAKLDGAMNPTEDTRPKTGDLTVCVYCTAVSRFNSKMELKLVTSDEFDKLSRKLKDSVASFQALVREAQDRTNNLKEKKGDGQ